MKNNLLMRRSDCWAAAFLLVALVFLFRQTPNGFWRNDDPYILLHALQSPGLSAFFDPENWQRLSPAHLTPWVTLSFKLDVWLAGLSPAFFYVHQLLALAVTTLALYALARQALPWLGALAAGLLFLLGAPTVSVAEQLMTRHYLEGLAFTLLAVLAFVKAEREGRLGWALIGAALYALATTAKETYVPLPLVLLCLPFSRGEAAGGAPAGASLSASWRLRIRMLVPYALMALFYVCWRYYMLGHFLGGYLGPGMSALEGANDMDTVAALGANLYQILKAFLHLPALFFGDFWALPTGVFVAGLLFVLWRRPEWIALTLALIVCLFVPLMPVAIVPGIRAPDRYVFLLWAVFCLLAVWLLQELLNAIPSWKKLACFFRPLLGGALFAALLAPTMMQGTAYARQQEAVARALDVQARFIMENDEGACFVPSQGGLELTLTALLCTHVRQGEGFCPQFVFSDVPLEQPCKQVFAYDPARNSMVEVAEPQRQSVDTDRALRAEMSFRNGVFHWALGPYSAGQYSLASSRWGRLDGLTSAPGVAPAAYGALSMHVLYESPEGWKTISPLLKVNRGKPLIWERKALPNEP